jgi:hypothetical protein
MAQKKKVVKKKITKAKGQKAQTITQTVNVNVSGKTKTKSGGRRKKALKGTPPENRISTGYILPGTPAWQINPSAQPQFQKQEDRQLLLEDFKRQFPLLGYTPQQPAITQFGEETSKPIIEETPTEYTIDEGEGLSRTSTFTSELPAQPISLMPPSQKKTPQGKNEDEKTALSKQKLASLGFPDRISVSGSNRSGDIDVVVQMMINSNKSGGNVKAADLNRVYGIDGTTIARREEKLTGIQKERRQKK